MNDTIFAADQINTAGHFALCDTCAYAAEYAEVELLNPEDRANFRDFLDTTGHIWRAGRGETGGHFHCEACGHHVYDDPHVFQNDQAGL